MLSDFAYCIFNGIIVLELLIVLSTVYAYLVDRSRPDDDPRKKDFHPAAILLAPFTWPIVLFLFLLLFFLRFVIFVIKAIGFGIFLILFTLALIGVRKPFLLVWLDKILTSTGEALLEFNTLIIRIFLSPWFEQRQAA